MHAFPVARCRGTHDDAALAVSAPEARYTLLDTLWITPPVRAQQRSVTVGDGSGIDTTQQLTNERLRRGEGGKAGSTHAFAQQLACGEYDVSAAHVVDAHFDRQKLRPLFAAGATETIDVDAVRCLAAIDQLQVVAGTIAMRSAVTAPSTQ
jgi:hypothetical protein